MKSPNIYVGLYNDIRTGSVYSSIEEAVKEARRIRPEGTSLMFIYLPDSERYWIAGTVGPGWDPRFNLVFMESSAADEHASKLRARGFPLKQIVCREMEIKHAGPSTVDIKTEEHYKVERELDGLHKALSMGLECCNSPTRAPLIAFNDALGYDYKKFAMLDLEAAKWTRPDKFADAVGSLRSAARLLAEVASVDPETQPLKWSRIQAAAHSFSGTPIYIGEDDNGTPEGDAKDTDQSPST